MSREIRFRVWDKEDKKYLLPENQEFVILPTKPSFGVTIPFQSESYPNENLDIDCVDWADADLIMGRYELEQYTGLRDENGKEIYEGDIVNVIGTGIAQVIDSPSGEWMLYYRLKPDEINSGFASVVPKNKPSGLWKTNTTSYIEVIGNIHENPELIGGG